MRVLHIIESLRSGGKERQLVELLAGMSGLEDVEAELIIMSEDVHYERISNLNIPTFKMPRRGGIDPGMLLCVGKIIRERKPDIVHSWGAKCSAYSVLAAKCSGAAFINGMIRDSRPYSWLNKECWIEKLTEPLSDVVVSNSQAGLRSYRVGQDKGVCIHNGFDFSRIRSLRPANEVRAELEIETPFFAVMVASFFPWKDHETFFAAARQVLERRRDITFVAVGDGPLLDNFRSSPELFSNRFINFTGRRSDVEDIVAASDIALLLTRPGCGGEGISNALTEAMAIGKPVIATKHGGNLELVRDGVDGILVEPQSTGDVVKALAALLGDLALMQRMGNTARARIQTEFNLTKMLHAYFELYHVVRRRRSGAKP